MQTINCDVTLFIRILEIVREELKDDASLHKMVDKLLRYQGSDKKVLTMEDYDSIFPTTLAASRLGIKDGM